MNVSQAIVYELVIVFARPVMYRGRRIGWWDTDETGRCTYTSEVSA